MNSSAARSYTLLRRRPRPSHGGGRRRASEKRSVQDQCANNGPGAARAGRPAVRVSDGEAERRPVKKTKEKKWISSSVAQEASPGKREFEKRCRPRRNLVAVPSSASGEFRALQRFPAKSPLSLGDEISIRNRVRSD